MLQLLGEVCEDRERVHQVERLVGIGKWRRQPRHRDVGEWEMALAPLDHPRVDVDAADARLRQSRPVAQNASASAAPVEQRVELLDWTAVVLEKLAQELGVMTAARQEDARVGVARPDLGAQVRGRERQPVVAADAARRDRPARGEQVLVDPHERTCEAQLLEQVEQRSPQPPTRRPRHDAKR